MLHSLRNRLILSHLLPSLITIPLVGILLIYAIESRILLPSLTRELEVDALLLTEIIRNRPEVWESPNTAEEVLRREDINLNGRTMLLDNGGHILASTDPADSEKIGSVSAVFEDIPLAQVNKTTTLTDFNARLDGEVIDVIAPVYNGEEERMGLVQVTYRYDSVYEQLFEFRFLLGTILLFALFAGGILGYILALNISTPIRHVAAAIFNLSQAQKSEPLPFTGQTEIDLQVHAVNYLFKRLENLESARRQLLANLIHELGRPLGALRSGLQALMQGAAEEPKLLEDLLVGMDLETARLQKLLDELAHLYNQVLGPLELDRQPLQLSRWLPQVLQTWCEAAHEKRQHCEIAIAENLSVVTADPDRLAQVIGNLMSNAIKYTPRRGNITVSAGENESKVWICVSDSGPGISLDEQQDIFDPFYRGGETQRIKQGMGLGLSIARDILTAHGGKLELESEPGMGSQFTIWLPKSVPTLYESVSESL